MIIHRINKACVTIVHKMLSLNIKYIEITIKDMHTKRDTDIMFNK